MNTIGKILVILNFVFALVVGGFLVIDFATRTNWRVAHERAKNELTVAKANYDVSTQTIAQLHNDLTRAKADRDTEKGKLVEQESLFKAERESLKLEVQTAKDQAMEADINSKKFQAQNILLTEEVKNRDGVISDREKTILALQESNKKYRTEAIANENVAKAMQLRNESLLAKLQDAERKLALLEAGGGVKTASGRVDPNAPNPPPSYVKGSIEKIFPNDANYVQVTLGSDHGVQKNHTLEVYRLSPQAQYLGMIRIVESFHHKSVGKIIPNNLAPKKLQEGDIVASSLSNQ